MVFIMLYLRHIALGLIVALAVSSAVCLVAGLGVRRFRWGLRPVHTGGVRPPWLAQLCLGWTRVACVARVSAVSGPPGEARCLWRLPGRPPSVVGGDPLLRSLDGCGNSSLVVVPVATPLCRGA